MLMKVDLLKESSTSEGWEAVCSLLKAQVNVRCNCGGEQCQENLEVRAVNFSAKKRV